jgi:hypothetical protein
MIAGVFNQEIRLFLLTMKKTFLLPLIPIAFFVISPLARATGDTNGFIVFEMERYSYKSNGPHSDETHRFKVALTDEFMSNFKHLPIPRASEGTGFYCGGGFPSKTCFMWWLERSSDHRWYIHMWSDGAESVGGVKLSSSNPACTQSMAINRLEDMDMSYQLSFEHKDDGLNVEFSAKYETARDISADGPIPDAPVRKAGAPDEVEFDTTNQVPFLRCGFQEN